jgi:hypothetical protein
VAKSYPARGTVDGSDDGLEEGGLLRLGLLQGDEGGSAETLGNSYGELEGLVDGSDDGLDEGALLRLGLFEGDEGGSAETLGNSYGELEGQ